MTEGAAIEALRARGAARLDAVRFGHIEALARRATAHEGAVRQVLDARLQQLLAACAQCLDSNPAPAPAAAEASRKASALSGLLAHIAQASQAGMPPAPTTPAAPRAPTELKAVRAHRKTWSRLRVDQQMHKALARVPDNAGPLNTQRLLHQALQLMRDASPEYTHRFMAQVDALLWLDQANPVIVVPPKKPAGRSR
jgi:hypothetical protein